MPDVPADSAGLGSGEEVHVDGIAGLVVPGVADVVSFQPEHVSALGGLGEVFRCGVWRPCYCGPGRAINITDPPSPTYRYSSGKRRAT